MVEKRILELENQTRGNSGCGIWKGVIADRYDFIHNWIENSMMSVDPIYRYDLMHDLIYHIVHKVNDDALKIHHDSLLIPAYKSF